MAGLFDSENIFERFRVIYGYNCYQNVVVVQKIAQCIYRHMISCGNYKPVVKRIIKSAIDYHSQKCRMHFPDMHSYAVDKSTHNVIVIAAHLCQKYDITDAPDLMKRLFDEAYGCDNGFDRWMSFLDPLTHSFELETLLYNLNNTTTNVIEESTKDTKQQLLILEYFLKQAALVDVRVNANYFEVDISRQRITQRDYVREVTFVNAPLSTCRGSTPLLLACHSSNPEAVLLLLRYGADPLQPGQTNHMVNLGFQQPLFILANKLNAINFWRMRIRYNNATLDAQFSEQREVDEEKIITCFKYFCRAMLQIPLRSSVVGPLDTNNNSYIAIRGNYSHVLPNDRTSCPAELQQQCRCTIRRCLKNAKQLPHGIHKLPLPSIMHSYIDLLID